MERSLQNEEAIAKELNIVGGEVFATNSTESLPSPKVTTRFWGGGGLVPHTTFISVRAFLKTGGNAPMQRILT